MKFVLSAIISLLFFIESVSAQKVKFKTLLSVVSCKTDNCMTQFLDDYGFSFINKKTVGNARNYSDIRHYTKGDIGNKKYIEAEYETRTDVTELVFRFTDGYLYQNLLKQIPKGFAGGNEISVKAQTAYTTKYLSKTNQGVAIVFIRPTVVSISDPYVISVQFER